VTSTLPIVMPAPAPAPAAPMAPSKAAPYALPIDRLNEVASAAGLEWVHSNSDKVRAAQAAMAAEPKAPRVPREPKLPVAIDDGPLVLVETKKDLSQITLPFDRG
jgi:ribonuclease E